MDDEITADSREFRDAVFRHSEGTTQWYIAPLVHFRNGMTCDVRTGVLLQISEYCFLVTAAHGLLEHDSAGETLHITMPTPDLKPLPLYNEQFWSTKSDDEDISVAQLHPESEEALGGHYRFLRLTDVMSRQEAEHANGRFLLIGFPTAMILQQPQGKELRPWTYLTSIYNGDYTHVERYDRCTHLVLHYERGSKNRENLLVHPPGLSGCGVWFVGNPITHGIVSAETFKLVAIQQSWNKKHEYIKATWLELVLYIIWRYYPDTRSSMRLHGIVF